MVSAVQDLNTPTAPITATENNNIQNTMQQEAVTPNLPAGTQVVPTMVQDTPNTELSSPGSQVQGDVSAQTTSAGPSQQVNSNVSQDFNTTAAQYNASTIGNNAAQGQATQLDQNAVNGAQATAAQGSITPEDTVQGQYENLTDFSKGTPGWAQGAINQVNDTMAARGLGSSSIAAGAETTAILGAALPIAQADASANLQMALANLSNQQQTNIANANIRTQALLAQFSADNQANLLNIQDRQQALLSDQAAQNAAAQFNATSQNQTTQFFANLATAIATQNAARADAMAQFNAGQSNAMAQFNSNLANDRQKFNAANQLVIDQSNVQWRRSINTTNTASINAANQVNAQNMFNMTMQAQANLWQQWRDEASWANTASENDKTRASNLAVASLESNTAFGLNNQVENEQMFQQLGSFAINLLNNVMS